MQIKLYYKLFATFLATSLMMVAIMVAVIQYTASRNFADYVNKMEMERLEDLVQELAAEYQREQGWGRLQHDPERWRDLTRPRGVLLFPPGPPGPANTPERRRSQEPLPPPPPPPPLPWNLNQGPPPPPPPGQNPFDFGPRISLFDARKQPLVGRGRTTQDHQLKSIQVNGKNVGWLGIRKPERLLHPPEVEFIQRQTQGLYLIGGSVLLLAMFVSFFFSRHLLSPIRRLTDGTRAISSRRFDTRIEVRTGDELGQLAADFNRMAQAMERYEQLRQQWISDISHELRTPLSILRAEIEALQDGVRKTTPEALESLHSEALHLSRIVQDLHDLSLLESGAFAAEPAAVSLMEVLEETLKSFRHRFAARGIGMELKIEGLKNITIMADADRLKQLFSNLLENTLRYAQAPGELSISYELSAGRLQLHFDDSGPGVPPESLGRLFDRLYRVDQARSRAQGGSGLGLAICKSIAEAFGGDIKAAPSPSGGLRISVNFPVLHMELQNAR